MAKLPGKKAKPQGSGDPGPRVLKPRGFASPAQRAKRAASSRQVTSPTVSAPPPASLPSDPSQPYVPSFVRNAEAAALKPVLTADGNVVLAIQNIARWRLEPWMFVREVLGVDPDDWQDAALHALVEAKDAEGVRIFMLCLKACKGPGKTALLAWVIWWFMLCFTHAKILCTSITAENLRDGLWSELALWRNKSVLLSAVFEWQSEKIYAKEHPETWFAAARTWPKDADKTKQATTLAGQHAKHTMIVLDEAGGIPVGVLAAGLAHHSTQGAEIETHYTLMAGNPDEVDSALGWACTVDAKNWWVKEITGDPDDPKRAKRIDIKWARDMIEKFGRENPWVLVNVFGKFPPVGSNKLLGPDQVRAAMHCHIHDDLWRRAPRVMALDVARSTNRDRSVLARRQGPVVFPFLTYRIADLNELAGQVAFEFGRWPADLIIIDSVGLGAGVFDHCKAIGLPVVAFNGGLPARDAVRFADRRMETWWVATQEIKGQGGTPMLALPQDGTLVNELTAPLINFTSKGQMRLESKDAMLKRGISSPDMADALAMLFAEPVTTATQIADSTLRNIHRNRMASEYDPYADEDRPRQED